MADSACVAGEVSFLKGFSKLAPRTAPVVLVMGGSCFMGRELVLSLLNKQVCVCVLNRGREYWGTSDPFDGQVAQILADRHGDVNEFSRRLDLATCRVGDNWDLVVDFSAFSGQHIRSALLGLQGRFRSYVYISSDSVYEVSSWAAENWKPGKGETNWVSEDACQRPLDAEKRDRIAYADRYGDGKLLAEEALVVGLAESAPQSRGLIVRLPDVVGPFDRTSRLWAYWHWMRVSTEHPVQVQLQKPPCENTGIEASTPLDPLLAFAYSKDVARFIMEVLMDGLPANTAQCDAVNLACTEQVTLAEFLTLFAACCGIESPTLEIDAHPWTFFPSVKRPWPLSCHNLTNTYTFVPTPLATALLESAAWFEHACTEFPQESHRAASKLPPRARETARMLVRLETQAVMA